MTEEWKQNWERRERLYEEQLEAYIATMKASECEICGKAGSPVVTLLGVLNAVLCTDCRNDWQQHFDNHPLASDCVDAQAAYHWAIHQADEELAKLKAREWQRVLDAIRGLSRQWLEGKGKWRSQD